MKMIEIKKILIFRADSFTAWEARSSVCHNLCETCCFTRYM